MYYMKYMYYCTARIHVKLVYALCATTYWCEHAAKHMYVIASAIMSLLRIMAVSTCAYHLQCLRCLRV
jgi:hypothetical protein